MIDDFRPILESHAIHDDESFDNALFDYSNRRFEGLMEMLDKAERRQFLDELVLLIFAHRRKKGFAYLQRFPNEAFEIVTRVCESFSQAYLDDYMQVPTLAFLFAWFTANGECKRFAQDAFKKQKKAIPGYVDS